MKCPKCNNKADIILKDHIYWLECPFCFFVARLKNLLTK